MQSYSNYEKMWNIEGIDDDRIVVIDNGNICAIAEEEEERNKIFSIIRISELKRNNKTKNTKTFRNIPLQYFLRRYS